MWLIPIISYKYKVYVYTAEYIYRSINVAEIYIWCIVSSSAIEEIVHQCDGNLACYHHVKKTKDRLLYRWKYIQSFLKYY